MSDAFTDAARAQRRLDQFELYVGAIYDYLRNPDRNTLDKVITTAHIIDSREGTKLSDELPKILLQLTIGDGPVDTPIKKAAWAKLLFKAQDSDYFNRLKKLSPFKDQIVAFVDYGMGFVRFHGDVNRLFSKPIADKGWQTFDCDKYVVVMPEPKPEDVQVFWTGSGICGIKGPRQADPNSNRTE